MKNALRAVVLLLTLIPLYGSDCSSGTSGNPNTNGKLYVLDEFNDAVYVYDNALNISGSLPPDRTISGIDFTGISQPTFLAVDGNRDILYVADSTFGNVFAFNPASTVSGDVAPLRTYTGVAKVGYMFYDNVNDRLYVTDINTQKIFVWDAISTLPTGTAPNRSFGLGYLPTGIFVDRQRDLLYVGDPSTQGVKVYDQPSTKSFNGIVQPTRSFSQVFSPAPNIVRPLQNVNGLTMNTALDLLFVTESSDIFSNDQNSENDFTPSIESYDQTSTLNGSVVAPREVMGASTGLTIDTHQPIFKISFNDALLFVQNTLTTISVWSNANQLDGDLAPDRSIQVNVPNARLVSFDIDLAH